LPGNHQHSAFAVHFENYSSLFFTSSDKYRAPKNKSQH
jgi:hypothetical protein